MRWIDGHVPLSNSENASLYSAILSGHMRSIEIVHDVPDICSTRARELT
jgi:hypothetical protein